MKENGELPGWCAILEELFEEVESRPHGKEAGGGDISHDKKIGSDTSI